MRTAHTPRTLITAAATTRQTSDSAYIAGAQVKEEVTDCGKKVKDECAEELSNLEEAKTELKRLKEERRAKMQVRPSSATKD